MKINFETAKCRKCGCEYISSKILSYGIYSEFRTRLDNCPMSSAGIKPYLYIEECSNCKYINYNIADEHEYNIVKYYLNDPQLLEYMQYKENIRRLLTIAYYKEKLRQFIKASSIYFIVAWLFEYEKDMKNALKYKYKSLEMFEKTETKKVTEDNIDMFMKYIDFFRTLSNFKKSKEIAVMLEKHLKDVIKNEESKHNPEGFKSKDLHKQEYLLRLVNFQLRLIEENDNSNHYINEVEDKFKEEKRKAREKFLEHIELDIKKNEELSNKNSLKDVYIINLKNNKNNNQIQFNYYAYLSKTTGKIELINYLGTDADQYRQYKDDFESYKINCEYAKNDEFALELFNTCKECYDKYMKLFEEDDETRLKLESL